MDLSIVSHGNTSHLPFINLSQNSEHKDITKAQYRAKQVVIAIISIFRSARASWNTFRFSNTYSRTYLAQFGLVAIKKKDISTEQFCNKTVYIEVARRKKEKKRENNKENEEGK